MEFADQREIEGAAGTKPSRRERQAVRASNVALAANVLLAALKLTVGTLGHSPALLADGINSTADVAYSVVVGVFVRLADKPPDHEHPYGHSQYETIGAVVVGAFVITTAIVIFWNAVDVVYSLWIGEGDFSGSSLGALAVAVFTIVLKLGLTVYTKRVGRRTNNSAVLALGQDHRNDVFAASAVAIGIALGRMGYPWVDPLAGAVVALVILHTGIEILRDASWNLMDTVPGRMLEREITDLLNDVPGVQQVEEIQAHRFGPYLVINLTIGIDGLVTVADGDKIASLVERKLSQQVDFVRRVHVHYHPTRPTNSPVAEEHVPEGSAAH